ncbi:hypothetical protein H2198_008922 [Neophaeococcomyces mojaviensis]|uniref:Uncharacterized protein n=1 Tax=Neophaeococcomyces mojaviensis TaxID=3383035 RepID=A0ACC2ZW04_9EURO|nr:hypothetical protein H2198_008922 [Knufia sp. JES_112]
MAPPVMTPAEARQTYDQLSPQYNLQYAHHKSDIKQMIRIAELQPAEIVLDLGTGLGWVAKEAAPHCTLAIGLDISNACIVRAKQEQTPQNCFFAVADMLQREDIQATTTSIVQQYTTLTSATNQSLTLQSPPYFDVVFLCWSFSHVPLQRRHELLTMLRDHIVRPGGRIVLDHQSSRCDIYTIEQVCLYQPSIPERPGHQEIKLWGRQRVAGKTSVMHARNELLPLVQAIGWRIARSKPFPIAEEDHYEDSTAQVQRRAQKLTPPGQEPRFEQLEAARREMFHQLPTAFKQSDAYPCAANGFQLVPFAGGSEVIDLTRHKVASIVAVLEASITTASDN